MTYKVIFDTSILRNPRSIDKFLGGDKELEKFSKVSEIIIPDMVIEEIKHQKKRYLVDRRDELIKNRFRRVMGISEKTIMDCNIDEFIQNLADEHKQEIPYDVISLTSYGIEDAKKLSLEKEAPFEKASNNDKERDDAGFKDAYIYFTVREFIEKKGEGKIFFVTKDRRLGEAFLELKEAAGRKPQLRVVNDFKKFQKYDDTYFRTEAFIDEFNEEYSENFTPDCIDDVWLYRDKSWIIRIWCYDTTECCMGERRICYIVADFQTQKVVNYIDYDYFADFTDIVNQDSVDSLRRGISLMDAFDEYASDQEIIDLIKAATTNKIIYSASTDSEINKFFVDIFNANSKIIPEEVQAEFREKFIDARDI